MRIGGCTDGHAQRIVLEGNDGLLDSRGRPVSRERCQPIGARVKMAGLRGVRCRSAQSRDGTGRDLAWFPASRRSIATPTLTLAFDGWYWAQESAP